MSKLHRVTLTAAAILISTGLHAADAIDYPGDYRQWTHAKSMTVHAGHALETPFKGIHHVYANAAAVDGPPGPLLGGKSPGSGYGLGSPVGSSVVVVGSGRDGTPARAGVPECGRDRRRSGDLPLFRRSLCQLSYPTLVLPGDR